MPTPQIYLASKSPRRATLLQQMGITYELLNIDVAEALGAGESAIEFAQRLALDKAKAGWQSVERELAIPVLGADTIVVVNDTILGKPKDKSDALTMMAQLSGVTHQAMTAIALVQGEQQSVCLSISDVTFREVTEQEASAYWDTGEPQDKAGGYGIHGIAAGFIKNLNGSFSGVMGLPLFELSELLPQFGIKIL